MNLNIDCTSILAVILLLSGVMQARAQQIAAAQDSLTLYEQGRHAAAEGSTEQALELWLQAKGEAAAPDLRLGTVFIELAAREQMSDYYELASLMYQWGLTAESVAAQREILEEEIERLVILTGRKEYSRWKDLLEEENPQIYRELQAFWEQLDPTPTTAYNERLIEHWERIAHSREHFTHSKSGIFEADERAEIYVRYGAPDRIHRDRLTFDQGVARGYATEIANAPRFCSAGSTTITNLVRAAQNWHQFPNYEVWVYNERPALESRQIFIFGDQARSGFGLVETIEELIPIQAFRSEQGNRCTAGLTPGLILQIIYYNQLSHVDSFFGNTFDELIDQAIDISIPASRYLAADVKGQARSELKLQKAKAPQEVSTYRSAMMEIPVRAYQYRLLDEQDNPYFATFVDSEPHQPFLLDYMHNYGGQGRENLNRQNLQGEGFNQYEYLHALQVYTAGDSLMGRLKDTPLIVTEKGRTSGSLFLVPFVGEGARLVVTARLENTDDDSRYAPEVTTPFKASLRGLGKQVVTQPAPLTPDPSRLQMGDLIVGYDYDEDAAGKIPFPFSVANEREIPAGEDLVIHVQLYHHRKNPEGRYSAKLTYQIKSKGGLLSNLLKDNDDMSLTLNIETSTPRYVENLQVTTRELKPGDYTMKLTAEDPQTGQSVEREFEFEVVE